jgi:hypothetical protein
MLVATLEDLQGSVEVVVFPKVYADTAPFWADDSIVLVSGRVDHRDDSAQILCEVVHAWDDAVRMGPVAFSAERDRLFRSRGGGWRNGGNGNGGGPSVPVPVGAGEPVAAAMPRGAVSVAAVAPPAEVAAPIVEPAEEPPAPVDAVPLAAVPSGSGTIEIGFESGLGMDRLLPAIESVTQAVRSRPGGVPVVISIPVAGATRQVKLRDGAEWDDRLADVVRQAAGVPVTVGLRAASVEG